MDHKFGKGNGKKSVLIRILIGVLASMAMAGMAMAGMAMAGLISTGIKMNEGTHAMNHAVNLMANNSKTFAKMDDQKTEIDCGQEIGATPREDKDLKRVALTFDDGPHPVWTEQLLDGLKKRGVVASFFVVGENAEKNPELLVRMQEEGHLIGNHTYSHMQLRKKNRKAFGEELIKTNEVIREAMGQETIYVRPPFGTWDKVYEKELNMIPVLWTVDTLDWSTTNVDALVEKVVHQVKDNDIILMHDIFESSVTAALEIVDILLKEGYRFVTVEEILLD